MDADTETPSATAASVDELKNSARERVAAAELNDAADTNHLSNGGENGEEKAAVVINGNGGGHASEPLNEEEEDIGDKVTTIVKNGEESSETERDISGSAQNGCIDHDLDRNVDSGTTEEKPEVDEKEEVVLVVKGDEEVGGDLAPKEETELDVKDEKIDIVDGETPANTEVI